MHWFNDLICGTSNVAQIIISIAIMLLFGLLLIRLTKLAKLPNVTGYIVAGILIGPYVLNLIPTNVIDGMDFISDIALAFISFSVGEFFRIKNIKKNGSKIIFLTLFEALTASVVVFCVMFFVFRLNLAFSIVLAALASATSPASILMTIRQTNSKGDYVNALLQVVAIDNIVSLVAYSVAISLAVASLGGSANFNFGVVAIPILKLLLSIIIGCIFGFILKFLLSRHSTDNRLIIVICGLFIFCGLATLLDVSPLLGCMIIGTVYINCSDDEKMFHQVNYFSPPILLLFFVRSGASLNLSALFSNTAILGFAPIWVIGLVFCLVRVFGKFLGVYFGGYATKSSKEVRDNLGLALIPQASVAIGLAVLGARTLGSEIGESLLTIILISSILCELVGPVCAKLSLYRTGSYSNNVEETISQKDATLNNATESKTEKTIKNKQQDSNIIESNVSSVEEIAFTEAGTQYANSGINNKDDNNNN